MARSFWPVHSLALALAGMLIGDCWLVLMWRKNVLQPGGSWMTTAIRLCELRIKEKVTEGHPERVEWVLDTVHNDLRDRLSIRWTWYIVSGLSLATLGYLIFSYQLKESAGEAPFERLFRVEGISLVDAVVVVTLALWLWLMVRDTLVRWKTTASEVAEIHDSVGPLAPPRIADEAPGGNDHGDEASAQGPSTAQRSAVPTDVGVAGGTAALSRLVPRGPGDAGSALGYPPALVPLPPAGNQSRPAGGGEDASPAVTGEGTDSAAAKPILSGPTMEQSRSLERSTGAADEGRVDHNRGRRLRRKS
jgi:hypothetical protein